MTISSETRRAGPYSGNGSTVNFPFAFKVFTTAQVLVTRTVSGVETVLTLTTDYTVTLNADQNANPGGTVTMLVAPPAGHSITITSNVANLQPTALANLGGFYPEVINDSLDRATMQIQQLDERLDRALTIPVSSSGINTELPPPESGKLIGWNLSADGLSNFVQVCYGSNANNLFDIIPSNLHAAILTFTSTADVSAYFKTMLETGGTWFIPDGKYLLGAKGVDTNSVDASLTKSVMVICGPRVQIVAEAGLDGDMIRAAVPSNGAGLSGKIDFIWQGGYFDQSGQNVSTSVPFILAYPPVNPGTSATADGLRVQGAYDPGSGLVNGIQLCKITNATFYCGDHWMTAGGDQSVTFGYGADLSVVRDCVFLGNRDLGVYMTPDSTATAKGRCIINDNLFVNCFGGASVKRSVNGFSINNNEFRNCVIGAAGLWIAGNKTSDGTIAFNRFRGCQVNIRLDYCERVSVVFNASDDAGALEDDGVTAVTAYQSYLINLKGSSYCTVSKNRSGGVVAAYSALLVQHIVLEDFDTGSGTVNSQYNEITDNLSDGLYAAGTETASEADNNRIEGNYEITGSVKNFICNGTASSEVRFDYSTGIQTRMTRELFNDGSASAPIIGRRSASNTGFGFAPNEIFGAVAGTKRHRVLNTGVEAIPAHTVRTTGGNAGVQRTLTSNLVTLASGASVTLPGARPAGARIVGVTTRITTGLTGSGGVTGIEIGDGSDADRYGVITGLSIGLTAGTLANPATADPAEFRATAGDIVITAVGGTFAGGVVRINVAYDYMLPAES